MLSGGVFPLGRFSYVKLSAPWRGTRQSDSKTPMSDRPREQFILPRIELPFPGLADLWREPEGECLMAGHSSMAKGGNAGGVIPGY